MKCPMSDCGLSVTSTKGKLKQHEGLGSITDFDDVWKVQVEE